MIKVGDMVKVINNGRTYDTYFDEEMFMDVKKPKCKNIEKYEAGFTPKNGETGTVIELYNHVWDIDTVIVDFGEHIAMINLEGVELV